MKRGFLTGLLILVIIYTITYLFFYEADYLDQIPRKIRHLIRFFILITVYLIGTYHLKLEKEKWMNACWHIIHISGIGIILSIGIYDWLIEATSSSIRNFSGIINEFLVSPILFVVIQLMSIVKELGKE